MIDFNDRIENLSPAKRELLMLQLKKLNGSTTHAETLTPHKNAMTMAELSAEARLDPAIDPKTARESVPGQVSSIFLTGSTGFVGAFLLAELLKQTRADIFCLVRAADQGEAQRRIQENLETYLLWDERQSSRIHPVVGDLAQPRLGLSIQEFDDLADQVDMIHHCGAMVKWTYPYSALKPANVLGTQEILRLACRVKVKPVHFISTIGVFSSPSFSSPVVLETEELESSGPLSVGYAQSKWVSEKLVRIAQARGLPASIYRPGTAGDSRTGVFNAHDHVCLLIKGCLQLGSAPHLDMPLQVAPVDYVSRAIIYLSGQLKALGKTYHLVNPNPIPWDDLFKWIRDSGYPLRQTTYAEWKQLLIQNVRSNPENALYALSPFISEFMLESASLPRFDCQNTLDGLAGTRLSCPPIDSALLNTYFDYFIRCGFLEEPVVEKKI
jgi:thioester reductase-like protein